AEDGIRDGHVTGVQTCALPISFKGTFPTTHLHSAKLWCDLIEPKECQILATYAKDFYAGRPAMTMNTFGLGKAIYIGTLSHQHRSEERRVGKECRTRWSTAYER